MLRPTQTRLSKFLFLLFFAVVWNGLMSFFIYLTFVRDSHTSFFPKAIVAILALCGLGIVAGAIQRFLALFHPVVRVTANATAIPRPTVKKISNLPMPKLHLGLRENRTSFFPGEELAGAALWELDAPPQRAVVATVTFDAPQAGDTRPFTLRLPAAPYSFSGKLISLVWAVELVVQPGSHCARTEIVVAPSGTEVLLPRDNK